MNYTPQPNTFSLFLNDKGGNEKRPDRKGDGNIVIDGKTYNLKLSGWERTSQSGKQSYRLGTLLQRPKLA